MADIGQYYKNYPKDSFFAIQEWAKCDIQCDVTCEAAVPGKTVYSGCNDEVGWHRRIR